MIFGRELEQKADVQIRTVLIVEDEPLVAFDNEHALVHAGYDVAATVNSYAHGVQVIDEGGIDLVLADVRLAGDSSGIDLARHAHGKGVPVLFVTGHCPLDAQDVAVGCLAKPYIPRILLAAIKAVEASLAGQRPGRTPRGLTLFGG